MDKETGKLENNPPKKNGGPRPGSGRPLHSKNASTIEREKALEGFKARVTKAADRLFNSQMNLAEGVTMLFKVEKDEKGNNKKPELVTDEHTISRFLDECGGYDGQLDGDTYYFLTTKMADNKAIDSMMDRTFGRAQQNVKVEDDRPNPLAIILDKYGITEEIENARKDAEASPSTPEESA